MISGVAKTDVVRSNKISPTYKAYWKRVDFINEGRSFPGRECLSELLAGSVLDAVGKEGWTG